MGIIIAGLSALIAAVAFVCAYSTLKVARSNRASYDSNKRVSRSFTDVAMGRVKDVECGRPGYPVDHFVVPYLGDDGRIVSLESAGSLSREAIDGVMVRPS